MCRADGPPLNQFLFGDTKKLGIEGPFEDGLDAFVMAELEAITRVHLSSTFIDWTTAFSCRVFQEHAVHAFALRSQALTKEINAFCGA